MQPDTTARIALVTGASRGIGAQVARQLAAPDTHVVVNYRKNAEGAKTVAEAIGAAGGHASTVAADICDEDATASMIDEIAQRFGRLNTLVLNATGGLEPGADPGRAIRINHDAQQRLARLALPLMPAGGNLIFVTSHQAHFYPNKAVPKGYATVAASKRAGETALYAMRSQIEHRGVRFTVVSGDMIEGTLVIELLERRDPTAMAMRHRHAAVSPATEFAGAIARAATAPHPAGIVYVGGPDHLGRKIA